MPRMKEEEGGNWESRKDRTHGGNRQKWHGMRKTDEKEDVTDNNGRKERRGKRQEEGRRKGRNGCN